ncbi:MBOAT family protein [Roseimicrobium sp. ORNL1]|uniref:MBOAT family O-acyltransferase n=1 Tax=Roseimicrobium sp. ORNL1 TaxID=2711231 RepID=UPI0013E16306|nr:MBOAT family protein [Roseimicrobium sp. ORNL1]QIF00796.1 MBOAT family protein [Roseimicrobium sp. ORNL1]
MLFLTYWFVLFAAAFFILYWCIPNTAVRVGLVLVSCVVFHTHFAGPAGVAPVLVLGVVTYFAARSQNKRACLAGIVLCVLALIFYKYSNFILTGMVAPIAPGLAKVLEGWAKHVLPAAPPLAISFFVFEFVHYLYDVRKGSAPLRNPADFGAFAVFWPTIVAGPIKRYEEFVPAMYAGARNVCQHDVAIGLIRITIGLVKKFIADNLTAYLAVWVPHYDALPLATKWWIFFALGLRILLDFSGYSDMAIGFARMMGIVIPENFRWPYLAKNINDFWRRWHISLSTWIRDYIYIPIGGNRYGIARRIFNGLVAFALCGLWHGAAWNFMLWGLYHGVGLAIASSYRELLGRPGRYLAVWFSHNRLLTWLMTMAFVHVGWLLFFYPVPKAWQMLKGLFGYY